MGPRRWTLVVWIFCVVLPTRVLGAPEQEPQAEASEPVVEAIALSKIGEEVDLAKARIEEVKMRIEDGPSLVRVERELPRIDERIAELEAEATPGELDALSEREIEDRTFVWQQVAVEVKELQVHLGDQSDRFESELQRVQSMLVRWEATAESPEITPNAKAQAEGIVRVATKIEDHIRGHLDTIHDAQTGVSASGHVVTRRLADFTAARETLRSRILTRGDPLWQVDPRAGESPVHLVTRTVQRQAEQVREFSSRGTGAFVASFAAWLVGWWVLVVLGRHPIGDDRETTLGLRSALRRPRSAALVLTIGVFALVGPPVPWVLRQAMWVLALPALLRLLASTPYRSITLAFAGPLLLSLLGETVPASSDWARYVHIAVSACGLLAALWVGPWRRSEAGTTIGAHGMRVAAVLLTVSIVANVAGYGALAPVINHATMFGIYFAVLIIGAVGVFQALVCMSVKTNVLRRSHAVRQYEDRIVSTMLRYVALGAWLIWVVAAADGFGIADPVWTWLKLWMEDPWEIGAFSLVPGDLLAFGLTLYAALLTSRLLGFALDEDVLPRLDLARGLPPTISMLARYSVLALGFMIAMAAAGVQLDKLSLLVGAFGVGIGFGLQNVVNNFVSGLILMFERPVKVGDTVEAGELLGEVTQIGIRASTLRTRQGAEVIVPNANLISSEVINWTLSDRQRRIDVDVGVAYGTDPDQVIGILSEAASANQRVLDEPPAVALFTGFGDSSLDFRLLTWTKDFDDWRGVRSEICVAVNRAFVDAGIEIPFPQRDLHVRSIEGGLASGAEIRLPARGDQRPDQQGGETSPGSTAAHR